jgi:hypothetical protein
MKPEMADGIGELSYIMRLQQILDRMQLFDDSEDVVESFMFFSHEKDIFRRYFRWEEI